MLPGAADVAQLNKFGLIHVARPQCADEHVVLIVGDADAARVQQKGEGAPMKPP